MSNSTAGSSGRMSYKRARFLLLAAGLGVLILVAVFQYIRGKDVDPTEMGGTLLFIPVFVAFVFGNVAGGVGAGLLAGLGYLALRYPAIQAIGAEDFMELILARTLFYVGFGAIGGWANKQLESSLNKLELYDQVDDSTGLQNARFFLHDTDLEMSRSTRYQTIFSVALVDIPSTALESLSRRQRVSVLKEIGRMLNDSVRTVDRTVHAQSATLHRLAVVLPETSKEGVTIFTNRLADRLADYLISKGAPITKEQVGRKTITFPGEEEAMGMVRAEFKDIERAEHPEAAQDEQDSAGEPDGRS